MAAPTIPPIRPGLTGTGLAAGKPHRPALCGLARSSPERRATRGGAEATTHTTVFRAVGSGHRAEPGGLPGHLISSSASIAA